MVPVLTQEKSARRKRHFLKHFLHGKKILTQPTAIDPSMALFIPVINMSIG